MSLGSLVLELEGNTARLESDMGRAVQIAESRLKVIDLAAARTAKQIEGIARAGATVQRSAGLEQTAKEVENIGFKSVGARRELLVLFHELSTGNFKRAAGSVQVLGERLDIMGKILSPVGLAVTAVAAAIGIFTYAVIEGALQSSHFNQSLLLTGNYAALTEGRFNSLIKSTAAATESTVGNAREMAQAFVSTGRFSGNALESVIQTSLKLQNATGQTSEEIVKNFDRMSDGVLKWALEVNRQYHFVDGALYDHLKTLEDQGRREEAELVASKALYAHLGGDAVKNVGALEQAWLNLKEALSAAKDELLAIGRATTVEDQIASLRTERSRILGAQQGAAGGVNSDIYSTQLASVDSRLGQLTAKQRNQQDNADLTATRKKHDEQVVEAKQFWDRFVETHHTGAEQMKKQLDEIARQGALAGASPADIAAAQEKIRKEFEPRQGGGTAHADFAAQVKPVQDQIASEDKLLKERESMLDKYYKDDKLSIDAYISGRQNAIDEYVAHVKDAYGREIAATQDYAAKSKDARTRITAQTRVGELQDKENDTLRQAAQQSAALTEDRARQTDTYRASVEKLNAELERMKGNLAAGTAENFDRTNASLKARATVEGDTGTLDNLAGLRAATVAQAQMNELQRQAQVVRDGLSVQTREINLRTQEGQQSELQGMAKISDARMQALAQLQAIDAQMQQTAAASSLPGLALQSRQFHESVAEMGTTTNDLGRNLSDMAANGLSKALDTSITRTKTLKQSFMDMANQIEQSITQMVSKDLANTLFGIGGSSGGGGWLSQIIGIGIGLLGGNAAGSEAIGASGTSTPDDLISGYRASGGPVAAGGMYEVNERGPELLTYANRTFLMMGDRAGKVTPMGASNAGGAGNTYHMNIAVPAGTTRQTAQQQAAEIMRHAQIASARNG